MPRYRRRYLKSYKCGEFEIVRHKILKDKELVSIEHNAKTGTTETIEIVLPNESINFIRKRLKQGIIDEDIIPFDEPFLKNYEKRVNEENFFNERMGRPKTTAKVVRKDKKKEKIIRGNLPAH